MSHSAAPPEPAASSSPPPVLHSFEWMAPARAPLTEVARLMADAGLRTAELRVSGNDGFVQVTDPDAQTLQDTLDLQHPDANLPRYQQAIDVLVRWQAATRPGVLPVLAPARLRNTLDGFAQTYLRQLRGLAIDAAMDKRLATAFEHLVEHHLGEPQVVVHGNFTPRALWLLPAQTPPILGVLDFQDAHHGPITYDIATLMRGTEPFWDEAFVIDITVRYWQAARAAGLPVGDDFGAFYRGVEWSGLQRHLQVLGAFAQRSLSDGPQDGLAEHAHRIHHVRSILGRYRELKPLLRVIDAAEGITDAAGYAFGRV